MRRAALEFRARVLRDVCVELSFERDVGSAKSRPLTEALERGAWHGAWTITVGSVPAGIAYALRYGWMDLPWMALAAQLGSFVAVAGAFYGAGIAFGEALAPRSPFPRLSALTLPALCGGLTGSLPGAFAAARFGRLPAPYFGTIEILIIGVLAFFLLGATSLHARGVPALRALVALGVALLLPLGGGLAFAVVVPSTGWAVDTLVLDAADRAPSLALFGAAFGAGVGVLFGGLLGLSGLLARGARRGTSRGAVSRGA